MGWKVKNRESAKKKRKEKDKKEEEIGCKDCDKMYIGETIFLQKGCTIYKRKQCGSETCSGTRSYIGKELHVWKKKK